MIDLEGHLPTCLVVRGEDVPVDTSFRTWLSFQRRLQETRLPWPGIFPDGIPPEGEWVPQAIEFLESRNAIPRQRTTKARMLDLLEDSDYVVAGFQQAYGIDLTACEMHWHRFLALLRGLPGETKLAEIMGYRSWDGSRRKPEQARAEMRDAWALPEEGDAELVEAQMRMFGGVTGG